MDLARLSLRELVDGQAHGDLTSEQITRHFLARAAALDARIHAFAWLDPDAALARARAADQHRVAGKRIKRLHGIPIGVKDVIATRAIPTRMGSPAFADHVPRVSAAVVQRLEAEGGFVFAKTVTAELAYYHPGETCNPWNLAHTPGGSSMGSAAAVAAGLVPAALGTQTNGSVIRPAAFCGCVGFKPSQGLIATSGIQPFAPTLDQVGVLARSIADAAHLSAALIEPAGEAAQALALGLAQAPPLYQPPRLAWVGSPVWHTAEVPQRELMQQAVARLRAAGAAVAQQELPALFATAHDVHRTIMQAEGARELRALQTTQRALLSEALNRLIDEGAAIEPARYREALEQRERLQGEFTRWCTPFDAVLTAPARGEAPATRAHTGDPAFCTIWTLVGAPALTFPAARGPHGLPLGVQIVGPIRQDAKLLAVAEWCAQAAGLRLDSPL